MTTNGRLAIRHRHRGCHWGCSADTESASALTTSTRCAVLTDDARPAMSSSGSGVRSPRARGCRSLAVRIDSHWRRRCQSSAWAGLGFGQNDPALTGRIGIPRSLLHQPPRTDRWSRRRYRRDSDDRAGLATRLRSTVTPQKARPGKTQVNLRWRGFGPCRVDVGTDGSKAESHCRSNGLSSNLSGSIYQFIVPCRAARHLGRVGGSQRKRDD